MTYQETTLTSADGHSLFMRIWTPDRPVRAVLVLVHGLGEHAGRYHHVVTAFLNEGYALYGCDHRGFGKSSGKRGHYERFDDLLDDLDQVITHARRAYPDQPLALYGHSLGAMIGTHYLARRIRPRHPAAVAAAVLSAPAYGPGPDLSPAKIRLSRVLARVAPGFTIDTGGSGSLQLSHDAEVQAAYAADPWCHDLVTTRFATVSLQKAVEAQTILPTLGLPILVILGDHDTVINRQAVLDAVAQAGPNVTFRRYPTCHESHNELPELREPVLRETVAWMAAALGPSS